MTAKNPKPLTQPRKGEPNHGKSCYQPGSLHTTDLPMQPSLGMQQRTITKGSVITTRINADIDDMINCPKIGKVVKIHDCVLTDCNYEKGHLICTGKSYVHCSFCEAIHPSLKEQMHGAEKDPVQVQPFDHKACILCDHVIVQKILGNKCGMSGSLCCNLKECPIEARKKREAVKEAQENPCEENGCTDTDNCDEICQHSRIYSPIQMQQAIAQAREQFAALIMRESPDTMQATELDGDLHAWNGETIMRVLNRLAQPEPTERDPE